MSGSDREAVESVLRVSGVAFPRGVLGPEAYELAAALVDDAPAERLAGLLDATAEAHWGEMQGPVAAAIARARSAAEDEAPFRRAAELAASADPHNALSRALALRAGRELAAALARVDTRLRELERAPDGVAVTRAAGEIVVELLELDPDDFGPEIVDYVQAGDDEEGAVGELARATADPEAREWARRSLRGLAGHGPGGAAVAALAQEPPPEDPAADPVWVATILALVAAGVEQAAAEDGGAA